MKYLIPAILLLFVISCTKTESPVNLDTLPSWKEGNTKNAIKSFVKAVSDENHSAFTPEVDRIAVFDNDGTLCAEQPIYFQLYFMLDKIKSLAPEHPEWQTTQPFKAALEDDFPRIAAYGKKGLATLLKGAYENVSTEELETLVKDWSLNSKHPMTGRKFTEMVYQPMLEVLDLLKANGFKIYIAYRGGLEFIRPWAEQAYGIPKEQVVGYSMKYNLVEVLAEPNDTIRLDEKVISLEKQIGKRPIMAFGNSDNDLSMMLFTDDQKKANFQMFINHTDPMREWKYDSISHIGQLREGFIIALNNGWMIANMETDWKVIYPHQPDSI